MVVVAVSVSGLFSGCSRAGDQVEVGLELDATLAERSALTASPTDPIRLVPGAPVEVALTISNHGDRPAALSHVAIDGDVLGLSFLAVDTAIDEVVEPGERRVVRFPLDTFDLDDQVHGLLRGEIGLYDPDGDLVASVPVFLDVRGGVLATTTILALALAFIAACAVAANLVLVRQRGPGTELATAARFAAAGLVAGSALSVAASVLRFWPLAVPEWLLVTFLCGLAAGVVGTSSLPDRVTTTIDLRQDLLSRGPLRATTPSRAHRIRKPSRS